MMYPPEPKVIYRDVPVMVQAPPIPPQQPIYQPPVLTEKPQEVQLPEYEPRKPISTSIRLDPELPLGLQETRPDGV